MAFGAMEHHLILLIVKREMRYLTEPFSILQDSLLAKEILDPSDVEAVASVPMGQVPYHFFKLQTKGNKTFVRVYYGIAEEFVVKST